MNISQKRKNVTRIDCIKQLFESSNRKVFLSNTCYTVDIQGVYEQLLMHNNRRGIVEILPKLEGIDVSQTVNI